MGHTEGLRQDQDDWLTDQAGGVPAVEISEGVVHVDDDTVVISQNKGFVPRRQGIERRGRSGRIDVAHNVDPARISTEDLNTESSA